FARLPAVTEGTRTLPGGKISMKAMPDLGFWVDPKTYLPVGQRFQLKRPDGEVVTMESHITAFEQYDGIVIDTKWTTYRNGQKWLETEVVKAQFYADGKKVDFSRP